MDNTPGILILKGIINVVMALAFAPFCQGVSRKVTALIQSRQGPPVMQPYYDLLKLLGKEDMESGDSPVMQRFAACLSLATALTVSCLIPMGFSSPMNGQGDIILLVYLLTLSGICTLLAGLAAGSTYSLIGISRQMMIMITLEPLFVIAVLIGAIHTGSFRLDTVLNGAVYIKEGFPWSGIIILIVLFLSFQAFVERVPFDISEAETEIMEGPLMEYSGPKLALFKYASMVKVVIYSALMIDILAPWDGGIPVALSWLLFWGKIFILVLFITLVSATHARYRIDQAIRFFVVLLAAAMTALITAICGY
jgi:formate hydrogenlyase subunit 4